MWGTTSGGIALSNTNEGKYLRQNVVNVKVSTVAHRKAVQLERFMRLSAANRVWGKDQKLIKYNILQVPNVRNYSVLLAMGRRRKNLGG